MTAITLSNINKRFGEKVLFRDYSLHIEAGEFVAIKGESGAGKTTLLNIIGLLETPDSGQVLFKGQDITDKKLNISQYRQSIGMVFQHFNVFPNLTVLELSLIHI